MAADRSIGDASDAHPWLRPKKALAATETGRYDPRRRTSTPAQGGGILAPLGQYDPGTSSPNDLALGSVDAAFVYVSGTNGIGVHARDPMTGLLTFVELEPRPPVFPFRDPDFLAITGRDQPIACWEATCSLPKRNDINSFTAKSD
jgi:hypothetical protein